MWLKLKDEYPPENTPVLLACDYGGEIIYNVAFWLDDKRDGPMWYGYGSIPRSIIKGWKKIEPYD
jgi:hypothetical protein